MAQQILDPPTDDFFDEDRKIVEHLLAELGISFKKRNEARSRPEVNPSDAVNFSPPRLHQSRAQALQRIRKWVKMKLMLSQTAIVYDSGLAFERMDKDFLCSISRYFNNALNGPFMEATTRIIRLRHDFPWAVYAMLDFLRNGSYYMYPVLQQQYPRITMLDLHVHCYIVADKYDIPALANYAAVNYLRIVADVLALDWKFDDPDFYDESENLPCVNYHYWDMCAAAEVSRFLDSVVLLWRNTASSHDALRKVVLEMIMACFIKLMRLKSFQFVFHTFKEFRWDLAESFGEDGLEMSGRKRKENGYNSRTSTPTPLLKPIPTPETTPGSALIKVTVAPVLSYAREVYNGTRKYPYTAPIVPGTSCIGRVAALGRDSTSLKVGQLVYADATIHSRDNPDDIILHGLTAGASTGSKKLMEEVWRDGTYGEYTLVPLESVFALDEKRMKELGYGEEELATMTKYLCVGGLRDINLQAGETIVVAPATGAFGGAAVACSVAMGASVVAMGRNADSLARLEETFPRVKTVRITESVEDDVAALQAAAGGRAIDAVFEVSPPQAAKSTHVKSCILALKRGGRMSLMGGIQEDYPIPLRQVMRKNLTLRGTWMYNREQVLALIKMVETGILKLGKQGGMRDMTVFGFAQWEKAFDHASDNAGWATTVLMRP
ncbi:uncharacterized protein N0V89_003510 [Didymosphaeria variabile]|uniref:Alcohol dehydrogenase-like C-terminal domain-containing protein n=1 Tax=Didymosphaeria variabile TaxID=1932322 RepID=A0A9W9CBK6_9PLEO|nr:uncharacterized protein N0V89_003510 [Didymosphaeria variabile]KAJ4355494.1 hypothetical protein N0V89_003510 [Didymosphaeria variabile]